MAKQLNDWMAAQPLERQNKILAKADQIQASICLAEMHKQQGITQAQLPEGYDLLCSCVYLSGRPKQQRISAGRFTLTPLSNPNKQLDQRYDNLTQLLL